MNPRGAVLVLESCALAVAAGCAPAARVAVRDAEGLAAARGREVALRDPSDRAGLFSADGLRKALAGALGRAGFREGAPGRAAAELFVTVEPKAEPVAPGRTGRPPAYGDPAGRRTYYGPERPGEEGPGPGLRAEAVLTEARTGRVLYRAELEGPARDLTEETLAEALLGPLEE
jgi:hypothetical protein